MIMTGLAIGLIKARDEISEVVCFIFFLADKTFRTLLLDTFVLVIFLMLVLDDTFLSNMAGGAFHPFLVFP